MAKYSSARSPGRSPHLSQDEDSPDEQGSAINEEIIYFNEAIGNDGFLIRDPSPVVRIHPSNIHELSDQSKFRFKVVVDYGWEPLYLPGRLVATHVSNKFVAYIVNVSGLGAVRIMDLDSKERCLMKVDKGVVKDVEFMHKGEDVYIGFVDEYGTFYINRIHKDAQSAKLSYHQVFKITLDGTHKKSDFRRFIWCKFVPDEISEVASIKDCAYQFAVLQDDMIYAGNLIKMANNHDEGCYTVNELRDDLIIIDTHSGPVTDASFAPDGTALATASKDGTVKFFQIYFQDIERNPPRCLYSWEPHGGRPIDRLMFLDNHSIRPSAESQYWKFMITCAENMTEVKLFTCKTWECLQTLHFETGQWKMEIDVTAHYLLTTDLNRKAIYLLHFDHDDESARVDWIREFSLPFNVLSFNLVTATRYQMGEIVNKGLSDFVAGNAEDYKGDAEMVLIEANMVNQKSLHKGTIAIDPPQAFCRSNGHHITFQRHVQYKEIAKNDGADEPTLGVDEDDDEDDESAISGTLISNQSGTQLTNQIHPRLEHSEGSPPLPILTNSIRKKNSMSPLADGPQATPSVAQMSEQLSSLIGISPGGTIVPRPPSSVHGTTSSHHTKTPSPNPARQQRNALDEFIIPREANPSTNGNISKASSSSSPSREVEEILSPKNTEILSHRSEATIDELLANMATVGLDSVENGNLPANLLQSKPDGHFNTRIKAKENSTHPNDELAGGGVGQVVEKVESMIDMLSNQATEIQDLKHEVVRLNIGLNQTEDVHALRKVVEGYFKDSQLRMNRLEETMKKLETQERSKVNQNANNPFPPNLPELLAASIGNVVKKEIETIVPATLERVYEPGRMNVQSQIEKLTSVIEAKLTQNIAHLFQQSKIWEPITNNFKTVTKTIFEQTFNEIFTNTVYPRCQNVATEMFTQVNDAFSVGTNQYLHNLQEVLESERKKDNVPEALRMHIGNMQDALSSALQVEVEAQMLRVIQGLQGSVVRQLEESIARELAHSFQEQKKYFEISVLPRTVTPAVSVTDHHYGVSPNMNDPVQMQRALLSLAKNGEVVNAFVQACNYGDLQVLMYLCKNLPPTKVFDSKLPHQTHVSILQQMATDIQQDTDVKLAYLHAAIGSLDTSDRKTLQSVARVLPVFQASVAKYVAQNPDSKLISNIKLLEMALVGLCQHITSPQVQTPHHLQSQSSSQHSFNTQY